MDCSCGCLVLPQVQPVRHTRTASAVYIHGVLVPCAAMACGPCAATELAATGLQAAAWQGASGVTCVSGHTLTTLLLLAAAAPCSFLLLVLALLCCTICPLQRSIALPDVHSGYGFAIGNVAAFDMNNPEVGNGAWSPLEQYDCNGSSIWLCRGCAVGVGMPMLMQQRLISAMPCLSSSVALF